MNDKWDIASRSRQRVRENGEVFTPMNIARDMADLIPDSAWEDPSFCFLEPACGHGNLLITIFNKRLECGIPVEVILNTMVGMDICPQNIQDCHNRLYELVGNVSKNEMKRIVAIVENNIFLVKDSLQFIKSGQLEIKKFFYYDPNGNNQVLSKIEQQTKLLNIEQRLSTLRPLFVGEEPKAA